MARFTAQDVADQLAGLPIDLYEDMAEGSDDDLSMDDEGIINNKTASK